MFKSKPGIALMVCIGIFFGIAGYSHAQYSGPGGSSKSTSTSDKIKSVLGMDDDDKDDKNALSVKKLERDPVYNREVVLKGRITKKTGKKEYRFEDRSGDMKMIIEDRLFARKDISENSRVEVTGILKKEGKKREAVFNATRLKVLKK